jgi:hypothetical protein
MAKQRGLLIIDLYAILEAVVFEGSSRFSCLIRLSKDVGGSDLSVVW